MRPLAHHAGEESLATLLLLGSGTFSVVVAVGRAKLAAARARLTGRARPPRSSANRYPPDTAGASRFMYRWREPM
jgi:hypothetical protein